MGLWVLWTHLYGFGTFVLGFVPNRTQRIALSFRWAYGLVGPFVVETLQLEFVLWQVPLHLGSGAMN